MKAICLPSGDQRGAAIWRLWRRDLGGVEDRLWRWLRGDRLDGLYIKLGYPPVVLAGRIGGNVGHLSGVG